MEQRVCDLLAPHEDQLRESRGEWQWHTAEVISEIPWGYLATYGEVASIVNRRFYHNIIPRNVGNLRGVLYELFRPFDVLPLHRVAKQGDVMSYFDSPLTRAENHILRGQEGSLAHPRWSGQD